jgi:hypothetical protein
MRVIIKERSMEHFRSKPGDGRHGGREGQGIPESITRAAKVGVEPCEIDEDSP